MIDIDSFMQDWGKKNVILSFDDDGRRFAMPGIINGNEGKLILFVDQYGRKRLIHIEDIRQVAEK